MKKALTYVGDFVYFVHVFFAWFPIWILIIGGVATVLLIFTPDTGDLQGWMQTLVSASEHLKALVSFLWNDVMLEVYSALGIYTFALLLFAIVVGTTLAYLGSFNTALATIPNIIAVVTETVTIYWASVWTFAIESDVPPVLLALYNVVPKIKKAWDLGEYTYWHIPMFVALIIALLLVVRKAIKLADGS